MSGEPIPRRRLRGVLAFSVLVVPIIAGIAFPAYRRSREVTWSKDCQEILARIEGAKATQLVFGPYNRRLR